MWTENIKHKNIRRHVIVTFLNSSGVVRSTPGGGGYLTKFNTGRLRPEVQPLTLLCTILAEKVLLLSMHSRLDMGMFFKKRLLFSSLSKRKLTIALQKLCLRLGLN